jgi:hypothetical protein
MFKYNAWLSVVIIGLLPATPAVHNKAPLKQRSNNNQHSNNTGKQNKLQQANCEYNA